MRATILRVRDWVWNTNQKNFFNVRSFCDEPFVQVLCGILRECGLEWAHVVCRVDDYGRVRACGYACSNFWHVETSVGVGGRTRINSNHKR